VLAFDLLRVLFANCMLLRGEMPLVGAPSIRVKSCEMSAHAPGTCGTDNVACLAVSCHVAQYGVPGAIVRKCTVRVAPGTL